MKKVKQHALNLILCFWIISLVEIIFQKSLLANSVGDIRVSILPPLEFKKVNGEEWIPLDQYMPIAVNPLQQIVKSTYRDQIYLYIKTHELVKPTQCFKLVRNSNSKDISKRFNCLHLIVKKWENNEIKITLSEIEMTIREIVFLKNDHYEKLNEFQLNEIERLKLKFPSFILIN